MLRKEKLQAFTLIELLVVITILAIISVVAYTKFSGSTDAAKNSKKLNDASSIETALNMFNQDKNYYPMPAVFSNKNLWGYNSGEIAQINNTLILDKPESQILGITSSAGGGRVMDIAGTNQIGAKGTLDSTILSKQYLSQELFDPSIKEIKVGDNDTMKDFGIGKYIYGVYAKGGTFLSNDTKGSSYNVAITLKDEQKGYLTKIFGNFDKDTCSSCPNSIIGPGGVANNNLTDGESSLTGSVTDANDRTPYPIQF